MRIVLPGLDHGSRQVLWLIGRDDSSFGGQRLDQFDLMVIYMFTMRKNLEDKIEKLSAETAKAEVDEAGQTWLADQAYKT